MTRPILLLVCLVVAACGKTDPVAHNAASPPDNLVGDESASGLAGPANAAAAEAAQRGALPPPTDGLAWFGSADGLSAYYGAKPTEAQLTIACVRGGAAPQIVITRHDPAPDASKATLSFTGAGHVASIPVASMLTPGGPGHAEWQGRAVGDNAYAMERPFHVEGPVEVTLGGAPDLVVPASAPVRAVFAGCIGG